MKKILAITFCLTLFGLSNSYSQTVNDVPIKDIDVEYIQIVGTSKMFSTKVTIQIDFGQENKFFKDNTRVKDGEGKPVDFNSMIDALNFLNENGYGFVTAYAFAISNQNVYHYLLKKKEE